MSDYLSCREQYACLPDECSSEPAQAGMQSHSNEAQASLTALIALRTKMTDFLSTRGKGTGESASEYKATEELIQLIDRSLGKIVSYLPYTEEVETRTVSCTLANQETKLHKELRRTKREEQAAVARNKLLRSLQKRIERRMRSSAVQPASLVHGDPCEGKHRQKLESLLQRKLRNLKKTHVAELAGYSRDVQVQLTTQWLNRIEELKKRVKSSMNHSQRLRHQVDYLKAVLHFYDVIGRKRVGSGSVGRGGGEEDEEAWEDVVRHKTRLNVILEEAALHETDFCQFAKELLRSRFFLKRRVPMVDVLRVVYRVYISSVS